MNAQTVNDPDLRARFFREAKVVAGLTHPSSVTLFDYGQDHEDDLLFMVFELIRGPTLRRVINAEAPLQPERVVRLAVQVLGLLLEAHTRGLVHRDLKPPNIMLVRQRSGDERAKVLDFGMAKVVQGDSGIFEENTKSGIVMGTPTYLSPEQAMARDEGPPADLCALGVVTYEMLCGRPPFRAPSAFELLVMHTNAEVPPLSPELGVPRGLEQVIRKALAKDLAHRFADAEEMLTALRRAVPKLADGDSRRQEGPPRPPIFPRKRRIPRSRRPWPPR